MVISRSVDAELEVVEELERCEKGGVALRLASFVTTPPAPKKERIEL